MIALDESGKTLQQRHAAWWQRQESLLTVSKGASLDQLWLPLADGTLAQEDLDLLPGMLDLNRLAGEPQEPGPLETFQDLFKGRDPYGKVPWVEAILGAPVRVTVQSGGMRTPAPIHEWTDWENSPEHFNVDWFETLLRLTRLLVKRSGGKYAVSQPTLRGPSDLAEALLGPKLMSYAMYDHPQSLRLFLEEATGTFIKILHALLDIFEPIQDGYLSPYGIWAPGTIVRTQCDATAFLSARHYAEWYLPYDLEICRSVDYSFMHLHSVSLHTIDCMLEQEHPHAFEVTLEARPKGPSLKAMLPVFRRILQVKPLLLVGRLTLDEVKWLQDHLPAGGLAITARQEEWYLPQSWTPADTPTHILRKEPHTLDAFDC